MAVPDPKTPTRQQLQRFLKDHEAVKLFERLFQRAGDLNPTDIETLYGLSEEAVILAETANARAIQAAEETRAAKSTRVLLWLSM